jgi:Fe-S cluster assembly protein SufD
VVPELPDLGGVRLVFVNGQYRPELSSKALPEGVTLVRFVDANENQAALIREKLGTAVKHEQHLFAALNAAALEDGLFLQVADNVSVKAPIQLVWSVTAQDRAFAVMQRLLVHMAANSNATLVEHFAGDPAETAVFSNGITELFLDAGAQLQHHRLHLEQGAAIHIGGVHARLSQDSNLESFHLAVGSELKRIDIVVDHQGQGAYCNLNGIYLVSNKDHVDYHTCLEHSVPQCTSSETFRGIVGDQASAVFNGRIHIPPHAQKTRAELRNNNLLTSNRAVINTKPELEIYADDVQCAHGATVAQLDPTILHYMRTRGISRAEAEVMMSYGFINELIRGLRCEPLREYLEPLLAQRLTPNSKLTRHIP